MRTILLIILILLLVGAFPAWPYSTGWGYYPSGGLGLVLLIVLILVLLGRIRRRNALLAGVLRRQSFLQRDGRFATATATMPGVISHLVPPDTAVVRERIHRDAVCLSARFQMSM